MLISSVILITTITPRKIVIIIISAIDLYSVIYARDDKSFSSSSSNFITSRLCELSSLDSMDEFMKFSVPSNSLVATFSFLTAYLG